MSIKVPLVIPTHKLVFTNKERRRIMNNEKMNSSITFAIPASNLKVFGSRYGDIGEIVTFDDEFFTNRVAYNRMLLSKVFWKKFLVHEKIIICQTDAILVKPTEQLNGFDYTFIGSPWKRPRKFRIVSGEVCISCRRHFFYPCEYLYVGNGGLSFRNTSDHLQVLGDFEFTTLPSVMLSGRVNEDLVFSYLFKSFSFPIPSPSVAASIFLEETAKGLRGIPDVFGFHALNRFNPDLETLILGSD